MYAVKDKGIWGIELMIMSFDLLIGVLIYYPMVLISTLDHTIRVCSFYGFDSYQTIKFDYGFSLRFRITLTSSRVEWTTEERRTANCNWSGSERELSLCWSSRELMLSRTGACWDRVANVFVAASWIVWARVWCELSKLELESCLSRDQVANKDRDVRFRDRD